MPARNQSNCPLVKRTEQTGKSVDQAGYRSVMRHKADTVCIIAAGLHGARGGLTATSVCSLSDDPPTVLVCINHAASLHELIASTGRFSVNLLAGNQMELADIFSGKTGVKGNDRFTDADWQAKDSGIPVLKDALASLECMLSDCHDFSTHSIFLGRVTAATARDDARPLIYRHGAYRILD